MNTNCRLHDLLLIRGPIFPTNGIIGAQPQTSKPYTDIRSSSVFTAPKRRYSCPKCPYSTDRRDLYTRHENIHRDEKPFRCYVCEKMFNRADHVKKHFLRIHKGVEYDVKLTKRVKGRDYDVKEDQNNNNNNNQNQNSIPNAKSVISHSNCYTTNPLLSELLYKRAFTNPISSNLSIESTINSNHNYEDQKLSHYRIPKCVQLTSDTKHFTTLSQQESNLKLNIDYENKDSINKSQNFRVQNHEDNKDEDYQCEYCGCTFINYCSLHTHRYLLHRYLLENSNYLPYRCVICGIRKITQRSMMSHMLNHNVFKSKECKKKEELKKINSSNRRKQLQPRKIVKFDFEDYCMEIDKKSDNKIIRAKFNCKICHKEFTTYTQLIQHQKFIKH